jgi:hypothetical protein
MGQEHGDRRLHRDRRVRLDQVEQPPVQLIGQAQEFIVGVPTILAQIWQNGDEEGGETGQNLLLIVQADLA